MNILHKNESIQEVHVQEMNIALLAAGDNTEIMRHHMAAGAHWTLMPETEFGELQFCYILTGEVHWKTAACTGVLRAGESITAHPVMEYIELFAKHDAEYIFISSRPVFHLHTGGLQEIERLAVEIEQKDGYTADHCSRIKTMSMDMAEAMDLTPEQQFDVKIGSFLHDVGKVRVPDSILNKPGPLTAAEWELMRQHPTFGREILVEVRQACLNGACEVIHQHHERYDGSGYPRGLSRDEIHIGAAIVAVVDSFDAMTTNRVYRKAKSVDTALRELAEGSGTLYHPKVVDVFLSSKLWLAAK